MKILYFTLLILVFNSCYKQERNCKDFKTGTFVFETEIDGVKKISEFVRTNDIEIESFEGKVDTSSIRWVSDCEYILEKINPKNMLERKAVNIKIITTNKEGYIFEYGIVGDSKKQRGIIKNK